MFSTCVLRRTLQLPVSLTGDSASTGGGAYAFSFEKTNELNGIPVPPDGRAGILCRKTRCSRGNISSK